MISNWRHSRFITRLSPEMSEQIALLKQQGILKRPERESPSFVSRMFLVKKSSRGVRPIFDLRGLNAHVRIRKFQLLTLQISRIFAGQRLYDQDRHSTSILPRTDCRESSAAPPSRIRQRASPDDELALWPLICPSYLCGYNELDRRPFAREV